MKLSAPRMASSLTGDPRLRSVTSLATARRRSRGNTEIEASYSRPRKAWTHLAFASLFRSQPGLRLSPVQVCRDQGPLTSNRSSDISISIRQCWGHCPNTQGPEQQFGIDLALTLSGIRTSLSPGDWSLATSSRRQRKLARPPYLRCYCFRHFRHFVSLLSQ